MNGRILALLGVSPLRKAVLRTLAATRSEVVEVADPTLALQQLATGGFHLAVVDHACCPTEQLLPLLAGVGARPSSQPPLLLLAERLPDAELARLFGVHPLAHLIGKAEPFESNELLVSCEKLLRGDLFGLEKYLCWGVEPEIVLLRSSTDRELLRERLGTFLGGLGVGTRFVEQAIGVADELAMNALWDAPVDRAGRPLYAGQSRRQSVVLAPGQEALFRYACDGRWIALAVRDPFGSLDPRRLYERLARCLEHGSGQIVEQGGGAGMGLYVMLTHTSQLVVNLAPGRATEVIGLIDISGPYRAFATRPKSFHLFCGDLLAGG